ncbi:MAG: hypothetical protein ACXVCY_16245 [Pseudobdellovibrionaceae bacterium]
MKRTKVILLFFTAGIALAPLKVFSEEVNDYHSDSVPEKKTLDEINRLINDQLQKLAKNLTAFGEASHSTKCDVAELKRLSVDFLDRNFTKIGNTLRDLQSKPLEKREYKVNLLQKNEQSNQALLNFTGVRACCVASVNIKGVVLGIDKIDHFFGNGGLLYSESLKNSTLKTKDIVNMSVNQENGMWGLAGSGIKSYGDLVANYEGYQFYRELFDGPSPFFKCENGKITKKRSFYIEKYVNVGWSEAVNCPAFPNKKAASAFAENLKKLNYRCPVSRDKCEELINIYKDQPDLLFHIVSPVCWAQREIENSVENANYADWTNIKDAIKGIRPEDVFNILIKGKR